MAHLIDLAKLSDVEWIISPGCPRSYRRDGSAGSKALSLLSPKRLRTRFTVAGETPTVVAIFLPSMRWPRRLSMRSITCGRVGLRSYLAPRAAILQPNQAFLLEAVAQFAAGARANACGFTGGLQRLTTRII